jgi:hypothetical protein
MRDYCDKAVRRNQSAAGWSWMDCERRILWAAGDIVENRPPLSRWHPDYADAFAAFVKKES